jgi:uncharacterized protein with HEPN domain
VRPTLADRIGHILDATDKIGTAVAGRTLDNFAKDIFMRLAVERLLQVVSEASRFIPDDIKAKNPTINWRGLADLGNWLRHAYHRTDADLMWEMIEHDLPPLETFIRTIAEEQKP